MTKSSYCQEQISPAALQELEAGAFESLCQHLQERSDQVANMDLMTLSGFCRNCLAKWMVVKARKLVDEDASSNPKLSARERLALNQLGYAEAAEHVYGMTYDEWKKRHQKKATKEQLQAYQDSSELHAKHDKALLEKREMPQQSTPAVSSSRLASNVCCQPEEVLISATPTPAPASPSKPKGPRQLPPFTPPSFPLDVPKPLHIAVITISDRASQGLYASGDLSGPAVVETVQEVYTGGECEFAHAIVPDDVEQIKQQLTQWEDQVHLVLTTGGTGFAARDVTPEATKQVVDVELPGLMTFVTAECSKVQPLASLSRGTAGILGNSTVVANLPGNPRAMAEILPILLPLLLHAVVDLQE